MLNSTRSFMNLAATAAALLLSAPAFASMGTVNCASGDGTLRRTEQEVWGTNVVTWTYQGKEVDPAQITVSGDPVVVNEEVRFHPNLGEERVLEDVQKVALTVTDGPQVSAFVLCTSVTYPNAYDF
jgi:hypothetical protein